MTLSHDQIRRFARHLKLAEIGVDGQEKLAAARIAIVGLGGLGSPAALYLAASGVGTLGLIDADVVDVSNLHRQVLFTAADEGKSKVSVAAARLRAIDGSLDVVEHPVRLGPTNSVPILSSYDVVVDGSDNFPTRYLVNDVCVMLGKPNVFGSVFKFEGQVAVFRPPADPCYRCLFTESPERGLVPDCGEAGVLGVLPGVVGALQATEAIKLVTGAGDLLTGRMLLYDALRMRFREVTIPKNPACPACGESPTIPIEEDYVEACASGDAARTAIEELSPKAAADRKKAGAVFIDVREPEEWEICRIEGSILVPLGELPMRMRELMPLRQAEIVVYCHRGMRSAEAAGFLREAGFANVRNLNGGIQRWSWEVDPSVPRY
ncbi:MAG: molybdopterin-synthase adenylyltransferase MoeB [Planctomycetes bacterium]|nr:molybdopterin-synthase adenylyltransferase MoeB [Planctomycetota bacterium]MBI3845349.1 molybdopterin-synthase adenylyltransferase MoeB [Planctomycetota bacterium]